MLLLLQKLIVLLQELLYSRRCKLGRRVYGQPVSRRRRCWQGREALVVPRLFSLFDRGLLRPACLLVSPLLIHILPRILARHKLFIAAYVEFTL
jgi:hypothetical protein